MNYSAVTVVFSLLIIPCNMAEERYLCATGKPSSDSECAYNCFPNCQVSTEQQRANEDCQCGNERPEHKDSCAATCKRECLNSCHRFNFDPTTCPRECDIECKRACDALHSNINGFNLRIADKKQCAPACKHGCEYLCSGRLFLRELSQRNCQKACQNSCERIDEEGHPSISEQPLSECQLACDELCKNYANSYKNCMKKCEDNCNGANENRATSVISSVFPVLNGAINEQLHIVRDASDNSRKIYTNCVRRCADYGSTQKGVNFKDECINACHIAVYGVRKTTTENATS